MLVDDGAGAEAWLDAIDAETSDPKQGYDEDSMALLCVLVMTGCFGRPAPEEGATATRERTRDPGGLDNPARGAYHSRAFGEPGSRRTAGFGEPGRAKKRRAAT